MHHHPTYYNFDFMPFHIILVPVEGLPQTNCSSGILGMDSGGLVPEWVSGSCRVLG